MSRRRRDRGTTSRGSRGFLRANRSDGGAALVEAAVAFPLIIMMIVGLIEIGLAFKDYLVVSAASREGARIAALAGTDDQSDCAVLIGISELASPGDLDRIDRIDIYKADEATGAQGLTDTAVPNPPNDPTVCTQPHGVNDGWTITPVNYPPTSRQTTVGSSDLDIVGVRVVMTRQWLTQFPPFRGTFTIDESTITRVEPEVFE
jgi:Flp pilus assembly protein TadG